MLNALSWWFGFGGTPVPIPNTEVKPISTDDTPCGESRLPPRLSIQRKRSPEKAVFCLSPNFVPKILRKE